jgi:hypothetical protein
MVFLSSQSQTTNTPYLTASIKYQRVFSLYQNPVQLILMECPLDGDKREIINSDNTPRVIFLQREMSRRKAL